MNSDMTNYSGDESELNEDMYAFSDNAEKPGQSQETNGLTHKKKKSLFTYIKKYFVGIFEIRSDMVSYVELHEMMEENTVIHGANMWILIMAIFIASIGLNVNSTAVIIGAMLVSPLMSGILTMGYSLATSNLGMLRKALLRFGTQMIISLITSTVYFMLTPLEVPTAEMIARTSPTLWDVLIALFGGIAGAIGNTRQKKGNVIPGVAIATALMPPLCTTGYGIATLQPRFIVGAFYLFLINTLFIMLSAALVTKLLGVPIHRSNDIKKQKNVRTMVTIITILTVIPSVLIGVYKVYQTVVEQNYNNYLNNEFVFDETQVVKSDMNMREKKITVSLVGTHISEDVIERLEQSLSQYNLQDYTLQVTQNKFIMQDVSDTVTVALQEKTIQSLQEELEQQQEQIVQQQEQLEQMEELFSGQINYTEVAQRAEHIFMDLSECSCGVMSDSMGQYVLLCATVEEPVLPEVEQTIQNWLMDETGLTRAVLHLTERINEADEGNDEEDSQTSNHM